MSDNKKVLVLGGEGFIGRNLSHLKDTYQMFSCAIEESVFKPRKDTFLKLNPYLQKSDFDNNFEVIIHLIDNKIAIDNFVNQELNLANNLRIAPGTHLIIFSSAVIYANPDCDYAKRKKLLEDFWSEYCKEKGMNLTILRLFNTFGLYQKPYRQGSLVANIFCNFLHNTSTEINDMAAQRDFVYSKDIAKIVDYVISNNIYGVFDIASSKMITIANMLKKIEQVIQKPLFINDKGNNESIICPVGNSFLYDKIKPTDFDDALKQTYDFYLKKNRI